MANKWYSMSSRIPSRRPAIATSAKERLYGRNTRRDMRPVPGTTNTCQPWTLWYVLLFVYATLIRINTYKNKIDFFKATYSRINAGRTRFSRTTPKQQLLIPVGPDLHTPNLDPMPKFGKLGTVVRILHPLIGTFRLSPSPDPPHGFGPTRVLHVLSSFCTH